jgi:nicotinate-nucleotide pyrophosphorylase (carboxylating)
MSGIATITNKFVKEVSDTSCKILDTRKTTPGWRKLEKYAVLCGGGTNHRMGLYDMVMIKDNHIASLSKTTETPIREAVIRARKVVGKSKKIIIEVDTLIQMVEALSIDPDVILLDNMDIQKLKKAVQLRNKTMPKILLEASGGVNLKTVKKIAKTGVDRISIGCLTHSVKSLDIGLDS